MMDTHSTSAAYDFARSFSFAHLIDATLKQYLPRPGLEAEIRSQLAGTAACCVVVGEPGSGKSALACAIIREGNSLHHFLRSEQTEFTLWRDPYAFLTSIGFQLKERFGEEIFPEAVAIDVHGRVRDVSDGAGVTVAEVQQLVAVPWRTVKLNVSLDAQRIDGHATGVRVKEIVDDYRRIPLSTFREMALFEPLRRLRKQHPEAHVLLWVDGLDEEATPGSAVAPPGHSIAEVLPLPSELTDLGNLAVGISSRPSTTLERFTDDGALTVDLGDPNFDEDNAALVERYVKRELASSVVQDRLAEAGKSPEELQREVISACSNNLLYLRQFFTAVVDGQLEDLIAGGIPAGLETIYVRLLRRMVRSSSDRFVTEFLPVLSALAISVEPVSSDQISWFSGLDRGRANGVLAKLRPFLDVERIERRNTYSLYHRSFREVLLSQQHGDEPWHIEPQAAHAFVARVYLSRWEAGSARMDDYGFQFLVYHLAGCDDDLKRKLFPLLREPWRRAKRERFGSNFSFDDDLVIAAEVAQTLPLAEMLIETSALVLMSVAITRAAGDLPEGAAEVMVGIGQVQRAMDYLRPTLRPHNGITLTAEVIKGLRRHEGATAILRRLVDQGLEWCASDPERSHGLLARLLRSLPHGGRGGDEAWVEDVLTRASEIFNAGLGYWETPCAMMEIARLRAHVDHDAGVELIRETQAAIERFAHSAKNLYSSDLFEYWSEIDARGAADALGKSSIELDRYAVRTVLSVSRANASSDNNQALPFARSFLRENAPRILDPFDRACALTDLAELELDLQDPASASAALVDAIAAVDAIGGPRDPDSVIGNRLDAAVEALVRLATVQMRLDPPQAQGTLRRAWEMLEQHPLRGEDLVSLVRAQLAASADVLHARVERVANPELRSNLCAAVALEMLNVGDLTAAAKWLEDALLVGERACGGGVQDASELAYAVARALIPPGDVPDAHLPEQLGLHRSLAVRWHTEVLDGLLRLAHPQASAWLTDTLKLWDHPQVNQNWLSELPALVGAALPTSLTAEFARAVQHLECRPQRQLMAASLCAPLRDIDRAMADVLLAIAVGEDDGSGSDPKAVERAAFLAGQLWQRDPHVAQRIWGNALWQAETARRDDDAYARSRASLALLEQLASGAPEVAAPVLLLHEEPPVPPNAIFFVLPGPGVPAHTSAGFSTHGDLLARTLARLVGNGLYPPERLTGLRDAAVRARACCAAAMAATDVALDVRVNLCEVAHLAVPDVQEHHLRCLLGADVCEAFAAVGPARKAQALARDVAVEVLENGTHFESIHRQPAYAHALGKCMQVLLSADSEPERLAAAVLFWEGRRLGLGVHTVLSYLPRVLTALGKEHLYALLEVERERALLFC